MSLNLPTLSDRSRERYATPKRQLATKLDRAVEKKAAKREDERKLAVWALAVKIRDGFKDRKTGQKLKRTHELDPLRAEAHHIVSRDDAAVRYDVRNGVTLSFQTHDAVERNTLRIVGTKVFKVNGTPYIDANFPVKFKVVT